MPQIKVTLEDIERARTVLRRILKPTPLLYNPWLSDLFQSEIYLKHENLQPIGSFKIRGATYKISRLSAKEKRKGVYAASAGNHAQGVAWGANRFRVRSTIVMPESAPLMKIHQTQALGAKVILKGENYDEAYEEANKLSKKANAAFVHPFDDADVIAGQGTIGLEIMDQLPDVDVVIGSMGGGGMMAGTATVLKSLRSQVTMVGVQASGARSLLESIKKKKVVSTGIVDTFADGIKTLHPRPNLVRMLSGLVDVLDHTNDEAIATAVLTLMEKAKTVAEGSGAVPLAVLEKRARQFKGKKVVLIISGGNIDMNVLGRIIDRGMIKTGRRVRLNVFISDRPGSLNRLTNLIAAKGANILQAIHDRDTPKAGLNETSVELTLETRGHEHSEELVSALRKRVLRLEFLH